MDTIKIITDHKWHDFKYGYELPSKWRKEFDYLTDEEFETRDFIVYRRWVYDSHEFMVTSGLPEFNPLTKWSGYHSDSFFSGVLIRYSQNCEQYQVATFLS